MITLALAAGVPCRWVTGDSVDGSDGRIWSWLEAQQLASVLGGTAHYRVFTGRIRAWAVAVVGRLPENTWRRHHQAVAKNGHR